MRITFIEKLYIVFTTIELLKNINEKSIIVFIVVENMKSESFFTNPIMLLEQMGTESSQPWLNLSASRSARFIATIQILFIYPHSYHTYAISNASNSSIYFESNILLSIFIKIDYQYRFIYKYINRYRI